MYSLIFSPALPLTHMTLALHACDSAANIGSIAARNKGAENSHCGCTEEKECCTEWDIVTCMQAHSLEGTLLSRHDHLPKTGAAESSKLTDQVPHSIAIIKAE